MLQLNYFIDNSEKFSDYEQCSDVMNTYIIPINGKEKKYRTRHGLSDFVEKEP